MRQAQRPPRELFSDMRPRTDESQRAGASVTLSNLPHSPLEDVYALFVGCVLVVLGLVLLRAAGLVTGGVAGLALLASYIVPLPTGLLFTLINIPFLLLAGRLMGREFMAKTVLVNAGITALSALAHYAIHLSATSEAFAAIGGGTLIGMGTLALARHGAGLGGSGVVTLWLQRTRGWNAGRSQMAIDAAILAVSFTIIVPDRLAWSLLSAVSMSGVMLAWHRPGRYTGG